MFDRKKYKEFAKIQLKSRWTVPILMSLIFFAVTILFSIPMAINSYNAINWDALLFETEDNFFSIYTNIMSKTNSYSDSLLSIVESIVEFIFTFAMLGVFLKMSKSPEPVKMSDFFEGFANFGRAILIGIYQSIFIFFWSLLFMIPGIVKYYSYSAMFYMGIEFPDVSVPELMNISKKITKGHKMDLFILDLSFFGWMFLGGLTCGIALLWIIPYYQMTWTNAYHAILKEALDRGIVTPEELNMKFEEPSETVAEPQETVAEPSRSTEATEQESSDEQ